MKKQLISTDKAPSAIGAYSQAIKVGDTVYISGQIPLNPQTMSVVDGGFEAQSRQVLANLSAVAQAAGGQLSDAVKFTVYVTDLDDFATLNDVMAEVLPEPFPARAVVQVSALPKEVSIEIDAILSI